MGSQHYVPVFFLEILSFGQALVLKIGLGSYFWEIKNILKEERCQDTLFWREN
jgi:hypothetical protein